MHAVTAHEMKELDQRAQQEYRIPPEILTEQAGLKTFLASRKYLEDEQRSSERIVCIAGPGNNGVDAMVIARECWNSGEMQVTVVQCGSSNGRAQQLQCEILSRMGIPALMYGEADASAAIHEADVIFDGLFGIGLSRPIAFGEYKSCVDDINRNDRAVVISIDLPSGVYDEMRAEDPRVRAALTVTFGHAKLSMYLRSARSSCGDIIIVNPGFPRSLLSQYGQKASIRPAQELRIRALERASYKSTRGHVAVFAGSVGYTGAARLVSEAVMRSGAGLTTLFCDEGIYQIAASCSASVIVTPVNSGAVISSTMLNQRFDAVVCGPGWGTGEQRERQFHEILSSGLPVVIDADAISLLADLIKQEGMDAKDFSRCMLTPHPGEFAPLVLALGLSESSSLYLAIREICARLGCTILYKSSINLICSAEGDISVTEGLTPALGVAGSGDVLAGIAGAAACRESDMKEVLWQANALHQLSGLRLWQDRGWFTAEDLFEVIGSVMKHYVREDSLDHDSPFD